jgi:hypothetical protein
MRTTLLLALATSLPAAALAQSNVGTTNKFSWGENVGWMNWRDAGNPVSSQGAVVRSSFLSGFVWGENIGWINLGDGTPVNGTSYANANGTDFGVNRDTITGNLSGFAWGENVGWINFSGGALATPAQPARYDRVAKRFTGFAWGENIGWINLSLAESGKFVDAIIPCGLADVAGAGQTIGPDGELTADDIIVFINWFFASDARADVAGAGQTIGADGQFTADDIIVFINRFFGGC